MLASVFKPHPFDLPFELRNIIDDISAHVRETYFTKTEFPGSGGFSDFSFLYSPVDSFIDWMGKGRKKQRGTQQQGPAKKQKGTDDHGGH